MTIEKRQRIERRIVQRLVMDALDAGYALAVDDGQDHFGPYKHTAEVLNRMFSVDEEHLDFYKDGKRAGCVWLIYGNDGYDVIADYTVTLEDLLAGANALADEICNSV